MQYGSIKELAKKLKTTRQNIIRVRRRIEQGKTIHSPLSKRILRELKKAQ